MSGGSGEWYVLVERMSASSSDSSWSLDKKLHVDGGREQALARAEELSRSYPKDHMGGETEWGYLVFRTSETSWLLEISHEYWSEHWDRPMTFTKHVRISVAQLVASKEIPPAEPPAAKKGKLRRALGRD
ncbi:hypothetical protein ACH4TV_04705 [Streptomyces sp. NPDC020898]|uniref:hypothetical protein n=1 Tax=Streptomyces sp. NPDC020898 TaxID=3365101 RepID=UPI0037932DB1